MNNNNLSSKNLVKEFEDSFSALIGLLANTNCQQSIESDELKLSVEHCAMKFIEKGKDMETFFLQKRFQLLSQKPENLIIEDIAEIKNEIARKDNLIERFNQKLETWQQILDDNYPISNQQPSHNPMLINQNQQMMNLQNNNLQNNIQNNNLQNNMQGNLQNSQLTPHQSMSAASIRQRSPIQQPIQNMPIHNTGLRQIMSPHHSYTPQLQNQSPMMNMQHSPAMSQDSPQMHSIQQSTSYAPTNQQQSHLAFLEKLIKKE